MRFRKKIGMCGEYEKYMYDYITYLYSLVVESKLTVGYRKVSFKSLTTTFPDDIRDAVRLYLDYYEKNALYSKGIEECKNIRGLIEIGKGCSFDNYPSNYGYVDMVITEKEKTKTILAVLEIVNEFEQNFFEKA